VEQRADARAIVTPRHSPRRQRSERWATRRAVVQPQRHNTFYLSSLVHCGICGRRMSEAWNDSEPYCRCEFPSEYAGATGQHTSTVYLREPDVPLRRLAPQRIRPQEPRRRRGCPPRRVDLRRWRNRSAEAARRAVKDCDTLPEVPRRPGGWNRSRPRSRSDQRGAGRPVPRRVRDGLDCGSGSAARGGRDSGSREVQRKALRSLAKATPEQRTTIYSETMGLRITYDPGSVSIEIKARPACTQVCRRGSRRGDLNPHALSGASPSIRGGPLPYQGESVTSLVSH
jgi:hypothetical protein